ncbi:hypothetical protein ACTFIU_002343 [Dictyostelium citrinum]
MIQPSDNDKNKKNEKLKEKEKEKEKKSKPIKKKDFVISAPTNFRSFDDPIPIQSQPPPPQQQEDNNDTQPPSQQQQQQQQQQQPPPLPNKNNCKLLPNNSNNNNNKDNLDELNEKIYFKVSKELLEDVKKWENKKQEYSKSIDSLLLKKQEQLNQIFRDYLLEMRPILDKHFANNDEMMDEKLKNEILENEEQRIQQVQQKLFGSKNASILTIESKIRLKRREIDMHNKITLIQSVVRGWLAKRRYKKLRSNIQRRQLCLQEIVETERKYVESLSLMIRLFLVPLQNQKKDLLSPTEIQSIFANSSVIYGVHKELLDTLELSLKFNNGNGIGGINGYGNNNNNNNSNVNSSDCKSIAECFLSLSPFLKLYTQYINNFNNASSTLIECKKRDSKINQFFFKDNRDNAQLGKRDFLDLQIQPVQRIPRYKLLLSELLSCTPTDHRDYENVKKALSVIQELALNINESKRTAEGLEKIILIQSCLTKFIELVKPHRRLIKDGPLLFERRGKLKERYLFLFNDSLLLCKKLNNILSTSDHNSISSSSNNSGIGGGNSGNNSVNSFSSIISISNFNSDIRFLPISFMDMNNVIVLPTQDPEYQHGFAILGNEHLYFYSKNAIEQHEWLLILKEISKELDQNLNSLRKETSELDLKDSMLNPLVKQHDSNRDSLLLATSITNPKRQSKILSEQQQQQINSQPRVVERYSGSSSNNNGNLSNSGGSNSPSSFSPQFNRSNGSIGSNGDSINNSPTQSQIIQPPSPLSSVQTISSPPPFILPQQHQQQVQQPIADLTIRELLSIYSEINELQKEMINPSNQFEVLFNGQLGQINMIRQQYPNVEMIYNKLTQILQRLSTLKNQSNALLSNQNTIQLLQNVIVQGKDHIGAYNEWIKRTYPMGPSDPSSTQPRFLTINFMKWYNNLHTVWGQILDLKQQL